MHALKTLLVESIQDLLDAEQQLTKALPAMAAAAHHPKLQEAFGKHLQQTENQVTRLEQACELLNEKVEPTPCRAMAGLIEEGQEKIEQSREMDDLTADLALIGAAQKVEHYEISAYGTARTLAFQIGERDVAMLLSHSLGEEESSDYLLTAIAKPILQEASNGREDASTGKAGATNGKTSRQSKSPRVRHA
jgi:Mn-containing catalase